MAELNVLQGAQSLVSIAPDAYRERRAIAESFGRAAESYDQFAGLQAQVADQVLARADLYNMPGICLDLGAGTGFCSLGLKKRFPDATLVALDLASPMLQKSRDKLGRELLCLGADAQALPLKQDSIDLVVSSLTMQWCENHAALFSDIARVLKPGARACLSTFGPQSLCELRQAWARVDDYTHVNDFVPASVLRQAASQAGLRLKLEEQRLTRYYASLAALGRELKGIGAQHVHQGRAKGLSSPARLKAASRIFAGKRVAQGIPVTYQIFYLTLEHTRHD